MPKKVFVPSLGREVTFFPRENLRRMRPCRTLAVPPKIQGAPVSVQLPSPPPIYDWSKGNSLTFKMYGNDTAGDCFVTTACHTSNAMTGNVGSEDDFDTPSLIQDYLKLSGGDNGLNTDQIMGYWRNGILGGPHKILDELNVNPFDPGAMLLAGWLYGGPQITMALLDAWIVNPGAGDVWDAAAGQQGNPDLGHAVYSSARTSHGQQIRTWGIDRPAPITVTPAGLAAADAEATVVFSPDWFDANGYAPNQFHYIQLATWWTMLGGHALPPWQGPTPPPPAPPTPPVPPSGKLFSLTFAHAMPKGGLVYFNTPVPIPVGVYDVVPRPTGAAFEPTAEE